VTTEKIALKALIDPAKVSAPDWAERAIASWEAVVDSAVKKAEAKMIAAESVLWDARDKLASLKEKEAQACRELLKAQKAWRAAKEKAE